MKPELLVLLTDDLTNRRKAGYFCCWTIHHSKSVSCVHNDDMGQSAVEKRAN